MAVPVQLFRKTHIRTKLSDRECPNLPIFQGFEYIFFLEVIRRAAIADLSRLAYEDQVSLFFVQVVCGLWIISKPEEDSNAQHESW